MTTYTMSIYIYKSFPRTCNIKLQVVTRGGDHLDHGITKEILYIKFEQLTHQQYNKKHIFELSIY